MFHIVLYQPEIPANTGNISRTCAATNTVLHLIKPLGFSLDDRHLKRAGLDYWSLLDVRIHASFESFLDSHGRASIWFVETYGERLYNEVRYPEDSFFIFGQETKGLPRELTESFRDRVIRIPMSPRPEARSLNLSNSVAVILFEAMRQNGFPGLR